MIRALPSKTVVFRLSSIGDIVLASPLLRVLRAAAGPKARIDFVVKKEFADLVRFNHHLSVVHELDTSEGFPALQRMRETLRDESYDLILDLHNNLRTTYLRNFANTKEAFVVDKRQFERWQLVHLKRDIYRDRIHVADRYIETVREFGIENDGKGLELFIPDETQFGVSGRLAKLRLNEFEKVIGVCPGARHFTKRWPRERFAEACIRLARSLRAKLLIFGGAEDRETGAGVSDSIRREAGATAATDLTGELSLLEVAAAMDFCDAVVTNDTGLMHIACARQRKVVALFGSTVLQLGFGPYGTDSIVVENKELRCRPCSHIGRDECPKGHFKCMNEITVEDVVRSVHRILSK